MNYIKIIVLILFLPLIGASANTLKGYVTDNIGNPIPGAYVYWQEFKQNVVVTTESGGFELKEQAGQNMLCIEYIGFEHACISIKDFSEEQHIVLQENNILDEAVITKSVSGKIKNRVDVLQTEKITVKELSRAACCNLSESFETNPSVDVSYSDAVTGAKQIQLLGLAGTYVQMLTENYPNMRGAAGIYGLDYIPGPWMEGIHVSKGAASVKNGYESLTGQINIEYKKPPTADPLSLNVFASDAGRYEANADGAIGLNDKLSTGIFLHYSNEEKAHDKNNDTFLDMPKKHQFNFMNRWHYQTDNFISQSGFKILNDERISGQTNHTLNNPGQNPYEIEVKTNRGELFTKNGFILDADRNESVAFIVSGTYHDQKSHYGLSQYNVYQTNLYGTFMYERNLGLKHKLSSGLNFNWDNFGGRESILQLQNYNQPNRESVSGAYTEYTFNHDDKFIVLAGIRADYSNLHKWFATPRLHVKYNIADWWHVRGSVGKGYRTTYVLPENSYLLASSRTIHVADNLDQESAWNYGLNSTFYIPIRGEELAINAEVFYTDFSNQVVMDMDTSPHDVYFYNLTGKSYAKTFQIEASYPVFRGFNLLGAYRWIDTKTDYNGVFRTKPLVSRYKALLTASYETPLRKWQFDFTTQFNGGGRMPAPDVENPLWDKDFKSFTLLNAQITKFFRDWSIYVGGENLTNFKQKNPVVSAHNPFGRDFDATMVWGPTQGRKFYVGLRYNISK